ncbi:2-oxoglutarate dehydrogenase complex dihydrolipoyllysine-residue succinyltransferase [Thermolongibacillus altinsuensis]|uniref:2-oxoglutarate dehydrogenase complex dihydrolipoyllysine-residue succinyltransferase n=1 Tax=Thermolongibacillus altinsuensis TaxID=575256 RepID=UPI00242A3098|nr:2-oxoglutarate dehydrogenase complex dihydrolipoyllysine-residue succinyltransferase [Thermolongibacillus altinsuensis]GMB09564.1 dihydrolipoyllysine-residue succinyltransferase component of 2-oxoglutarate dehydrogenase complex [Thermolongibacillus altinsuensis]
MAEIKVPELAESITEGTIFQWLKQPGDFIHKGEPIAELETDKVNVELVSEDSGVITKLLFNEGDTVRVGDTIAIVSEEAEANVPQAEETPKQLEKKKPSQPIAVKEEPVARPTQRPIASPSARKLAREKGIDLSKVTPFDPLGRIRKQDVEAYSNQSAPIAETVKPTTPDLFEPEKPVERIKMSRRRQTIAKRLVEVQHTAAMLTTFNEIDMTAIIDLRNRRKDAFYQEHDVRLGFMSFFTKAVVAALKKYPLLNAEIQGDEIIVKKYYDIGVAVSTEEGLVVPVVRDADKKNFAEIEREILHLATKARENKLSLKDLQGGTFTITNGGVFGSLLSTPILNGPQVGILGMHKIQLRPVAIDEVRMENRPMMYVALSYDHRIIDGKEAVGFLVKVKELLEDPEQLLLES